MANEARPPYRLIHKAVITGKIIPFLGAGAPLYTRNPRVTPWYRMEHEKEVISHLPTASELAEYLALQAEVAAEERGELTKMAQYYEVQAGIEALRKQLSEIFSYMQEPTPLHDYFAAAPVPLLIVTTNYDDLMERAFKNAGKPCDVVVHGTANDTVLWWRHGEAAPKEVPADNFLIDLDEVSVVYKMHGAIDRRTDSVGSYVITEDDYVEFLTRMTTSKVIPDIFARPFQTRPFLFLGYGLHDWNLRVILNQIQQFCGHPKFRSWAIETLSRPVEKRLWEARGINVYDGITPDQFLNELKKQANPAPEGAAPEGGN